MFIRASSFYVIDVVGLLVHVNRDVLLYTLTTKIIIISYSKKESGKNKLAAYNLIFDYQFYSKVFHDGLQFFMLETDLSI